MGTRRLISPLRVCGFFCMFRPVCMFCSVPAITDSRGELCVSEAGIRVSLRFLPLDEIRRVCRTMCEM